MNREATSNRIRNKTVMKGVEKRITTEEWMSGGQNKLQRKSYICWTKCIIVWQKRGVN